MAKWTKISKLFFGNLFDRKIGIILEMKDAVIFRGPTGRSPYFNFVKQIIELEKNNISASGVTQFSNNNAKLFYLSIHKPYFKFVNSKMEIFKN